MLHLLGCCIDFANVGGLRNICDLSAVVGRSYFVLLGLVIFLSFQFSVPLLSNLVFDIVSRYCWVV